MIWIILIVALAFASPYIFRWLQGFLSRWMMKIVRNRIRRMMGFPPEEPDKKSRRKESVADRARSGAERGGRNGHEPLIPKEYAVDVEYTEVHDYSSRTEIRPEKDGVRIVTESQVADAEYIVIRPGENPVFPSDKKKKKHFGL